MEDKDIIKLYFDRDERAIEETKNKYGRYCYSISYRILYNREDTEESVNDTYIAAWKSIPPEEPNKLSLYLAAIARNISLKRLRRSHAKKRGGEAGNTLAELSECIPGGTNPENEIENKELSKLLDSFVRSLSDEDRCYFIRRYWYMYSVSEIAKAYGCSESKIKMRLKRTRDKLKAFLEKEGIYL